MNNYDPDRVRDELLELLQSPQHTREVGLSRWEISRILGWPKGKAGEILRRMVEAGLIEAVLSRKPNIVGVVGPTVLYRVKSD